MSVDKEALVPLLGALERAQVKADAERALRAMCEGTKGTGCYPSVNTAEHRADMAVLSVDWTWLDYLSPGDALRVALLLMKIEEGGADDVVIATTSMLGRIRKTAEMRMAAEAAER